MREKMRGKKNARKKNARKNARKKCERLVVRYGLELSCAWHCDVGFFGWGKSVVVDECVKWCSVGWKMSTKYACVLFVKNANRKT